MLAKERKNTILRKLDIDLTVSVKELAKQLNVTMETIRKDLDFISNSNDKIIRVHGGAYKIQPVEGSPFYKDFDDAKLIAQSQIISRLAVDQICDGDVIMLDASIKSLFIVKELIFRNIKATIITNSLPSATIIATAKELNLICLGGNLDVPTFSFNGTYTLQTLKNMHSDKAFLSPTAISKNFGISHIDEFEAEMAKTMIDNSSKVYLVMQDSKFDKSTFTKIGAISDIDTIISYNHLSEKWTKLLKLNKVKSICSQI
jgi:DeoR/GlpR family transcriptional regulator of sugar metabolism